MGSLRSMENRGKVKDTFSCRSRSINTFPIEEQINLQILKLINDRNQILGGSAEPIY